MYIDPFWCGFLATVFIEIVALFAIALVAAIKRTRR